MSFHIQLSQFEGPLDLLLHLIDKSKIDIENLFVSMITEQYIEIVNNATDLDLEEASEFINMAALLVEIKSRHLLPKPPKEDEEDPEALLMARLIAYKQFKETAGNMVQFENSAKLAFTKLPEEFPLPPQPYTLEGLTLSALFEALLRVQTRVASDTSEPLFQLRDIRRDNFTVESCMEIIESRLSVGHTSFSSLFAIEADREEVVTLFIALLELLKLGKVHVLQSGTFADIMLLPGGKDEDDESPIATH